MNNNNDDTNMTELKKEQLDISERLQDLQKLIDEHQSTQTSTKAEDTPEKTGGRACRDNDMADTVNGLINDVADPTLKNILHTVLTNQFDQLVKAAGYTSGSGCMERMDPIMLAITRRVIENLYHSFSSIISIQPMHGPVDTVELLRAKKDDDAVSPPPVLVDLTMEACTLRLAAGWTIETAQDLNSLYGLDIEKEMTYALAQEIQNEIGQHIVRDLAQLGRMTTGEWKDHVNPDFKYEYAGGKELLRQIQIRVKRIKKHCKYGIKHSDRFFVIVSPVILSLLQTILDVDFVSNKGAPNAVSSLPIFKVGTIDDIDVYANMYMENDIVVGFKGKNDARTGYIYTPYVPILSSGVIVNPETFQPVVSLMTRGGHRSVVSDDTYADDSRDFYLTFTVEHNVDFVPPTTEPDLELENLLREYTPEKEMITQVNQGKLFAALSENGIDPIEATEEQIEELRPDFMETIENPETAQVRKITEQMIVNQYHALVDSEMTSRMRPALDMVVRVCANLYPTLTKLVGVQPMDHKSELGLGYRLTYRYQDIEPELEGTSGRKMTLNIVSQAVQAVTTRLLEGREIAVGDLEDGHELAVMSYDIADEILAGVFSDLCQLGEQGEADRLSNVNLKPTEAGNFPIVINMICNKIAQQTRRGAGNFVIMSTHAFQVLKLASANSKLFEPTKTISGSDLISYEGMLHGMIKVFVNTDAENDDLLVGYKGTSGECDTGYIYSPHTQIILSDKELNPATFDFDMEILTRCGKSTFSGDDNLSSSHNYYELLKMDLSGIEIP